MLLSEQVSEYQMVAIATGDAILSCVVNYACYCNQDCNIRRMNTIYYDCLVVNSHMSPSSSCIKSYEHRYGHRTADYIYSKGR
jgi:hypothetical protein